MSQPESAEPARITTDELALRLGVDRERVDRLADAGAIERDGAGTFDPGDVHRVRLLNAFEEAGVPLDALLAASRAGTISLRYYDELHPPPGELSGRTFEAFAASLGERRGHLARLFTAFGLAEPEPGARLSADDEALIGELLDIVVATGEPELALRAVRMFGEGSRRAADGALGVYGEAAARLGDDAVGLPVDALFERLLRPWARFARLSTELGAWLASYHLTRAIDEYSVAQTEEILETHGFVATRLDAPPAVAFVDLTGFTRLTEERGDEVAAGLALRLGEVTAEVVARHGGRLVKLLGDGVLVRFDEAAAAVSATLALLEALPAAGLPTGHAGVAAGPLIVRDGDVFGRTVNLAARISDVAPDGRVYVPASLAAALPAGAFAALPADAALLQGIGRVELMDVARAAPGARAPDSGARARVRPATLGRVAAYLGRSARRPTRPRSRPPPRLRPHTAERTRHPRASSRISRPRSCGRCRWGRPGRPGRAVATRRYAATRLGGAVSFGRRA